jgi:hypothetical protein
MCDGCRVRLFCIQMDIANGSVVFNDLEINVEALNATLLKNAAVMITSGYIKKATAQISCVRVAMSVVSSMQRCTWDESPRGDVHVRSWRVCVCV